MKKIILLTLLLFIFFSSQADPIKSKSPRHVHIISARMSVFYFKIDKEFLGAELAIYSMDGKKLVSQKVEHRKVLIDFHHENPGKFIIRIKKGDSQEEFEFIKDNPFLESDRPSETITVIQGV